MEMTKRIGLSTWGENEKEVTDYIIYNAPNVKMILQQVSENDENGLKNYLFEIVVPVNELENLKALKDVQLVSAYIKDEDIENAIVKE